MREVCRIAATVLKRLGEHVAPGISTLELDQIGARLIKEYGARSACHGYKNGRKRYPAHACISVNDEIVHGIGRADRVLVPGDIVTLDVCVEYGGFVGDNAHTYAVGLVSPVAQRLMDVTRKALELSIEQAIPGHSVLDVSTAMQRHVEGNGFSVVRDFVGHGVGRSMHEEPQIPCFATAASARIPLQVGMTICIEPMVCSGSSRTQYLSDGWTAVTRDHSLAAHEEETVLITPAGPEVLTIPD